MSIAALLFEKSITFSSEIFSPSIATNPLTPSTGLTINIPAVSPGS